MPNGKPDPNCSRCKGSGQEQVFYTEHAEWYICDCVGEVPTKRCPTCNGAGKVKDVPSVEGRSNG